MQPAPQAYWDTQRNEVQVVWGIGGRRRHFRLPPHPSNLDVLTVEAINDAEVAIFYGREGSRPQWVQVVGIMSGGVHQSTTWQAYRDGIARRAQHEHSLLPPVQQQQRRSEQQERERLRREAEAKAREREQQGRALAVRPRAEAPSCRATVPSRRGAQPSLPASREFIESRSAGRDYNDDKFDYDSYHTDVPWQYAFAYNATAAKRRSNRTGWTWLGGVLAVIAGLIALALIAATPTSDPMPVAEAFAVLSTLARALFGVIGLVLPRVGGAAVLLFATIGAGLTNNADVRIWMAVGFAGGLSLWFGRRNRARHGTMRKLVRVIVLGSVAALTIAEHVPTRHTAPKNTAATSKVLNWRSRGHDGTYPRWLRKTIHRK